MDFQSWNHKEPNIDSRLSLNQRSYCDLFFPTDSSTFIRYFWKLETILQTLCFSFSANSSFLALGAVSFGVISLWCSSHWRKMCHVGEVVWHKRQRGPNRRGCTSFCCESGHSRRLVRWIVCVENCTCYRSLEFPSSLHAFAIIAIGSVMSLDFYCRAIFHYIFLFRSHVIWSFAILSPRIVSQIYCAYVDYSKCGLEPSLIIIAEENLALWHPLMGICSRAVRVRDFVLQ